MALLIHESGHIIAIKALCKDYKEIRVTLFGINMFVNTQNILAIERIIIYAAGPISNIVVYYISKEFDNDVFATINYYIAVLNLLPLIPLDGGNIVKTFFQFIYNDIKASKIMIVINYVFIFIFIISMVIFPIPLKIVYIIMCMKGIKEERSSILNNKIKINYLKYINN